MESVAGTSGRGPSVIRVDADEARAAATAALERRGAPRRHAALQADVLVEAELRALPSHGLLRLPRIVERIANGVIDPLAAGTRTWRAEAAMVVDGQNGLGPVVAVGALDLLAVRARHTGVAAAFIRRGNHLGMLAYYVQRIAEGGQVALALTTSEALVHPWGGRRAMVGSNPIAIGVPASPRPLVLDMATSAVAMGKIHDYALRGRPLDPGWALDADGNPTTDAEAAKDGAISPFGGPKGAGLGIAFEVLVASLTGSALGEEVLGTLDSTNPCTKGDVFIVLDVPDADTTGPVSDYLDEVRRSPGHGVDPVRVPGDGARSRREVALAHGFDVPETVWRAILDAAEAPLVPETAR